MRHGMVNRKLGRTSGHRAALFRNQLASLIEHERIVTTLPKAKELRPQIERLVTIGKTDNVHNRRQVGRVIENDALVGKLFETISPRFAQRPGGYTRIIKMGARRGDAAERALIEFVDYVPKSEAAEETATPAPKAKKAAPKKEAKETKEEEAPAAAEAKPKKKASSKKPAAAKEEKEDKPKKKAGSKKSK